MSGIETHFIAAHHNHTLKIIDQRKMMSFKSYTCTKCLKTYEYYAIRGIVPPCPYCGYPELKTSDGYYKCMGIDNTRSKQ
jgi:DNA-directed RNA polymerase subunit RPC12/RpoP